MMKGKCYLDETHDAAAIEREGQVHLRSAQPFALMLLSEGSHSYGTGGWS